MLEVGEGVVDVRGGPFHSVVLTSRARVFISGNLYKRSSIAEDECTGEFIELNTAKFGRIVSIRSGLTGFCFLTSDSKLFALGHFGEHIFN
jgi:hypothetical protein